MHPKTRPRAGIVMRSNSTDLKVHRRPQTSARSRLSDVTGLRGPRMGAEIDMLGRAVDAAEPAFCVADPRETADSNRTDTHKWVKRGLYAVQSARQDNSLNGLAGNKEHALLR